MRADHRVRPSVRHAIRSGAVLLPLLLGACSWFTDFKRQPKIKPWQEQMAGNDTTPFRGNPEFSVPITGDPVPAYVVSHYGSVTWAPNAPPTIATIDSMSGLKNPTPPTAASLDNGRKYYQINCAVCHGANGGGGGPAVRYGVPAPSLLTPVTQNRTDGYIYGMIRNGRGMMPTYDRIEDMDRWDVVNYVRALQGKIPGVVADTSPAGYPGENGKTVPGATRTAPTRPAPYRPEDMAARMAMTEGGASAAPASSTDTTHHAAPSAAAAPNGARP
ncbi:MAG: cytochrome c [Gemmatimonadaceae bacterium]|nr:cytochrome c [Gemmatimonadaceae bacterium]